MPDFTLRLGQSLVLGNPERADAAIEEAWHDANLIEVTVAEVREEGERGGHAQVKLGIKAPRGVKVHRKEIWEQEQQENEAVNQPSS